MNMDTRPSAHTPAGTAERVDGLDGGRVTIGNSGLSALYSSAGPATSNVRCSRFRDEATWVMIAFRGIRNEAIA
jgi:hypothetical protein